MKNILAVFFIIILNNSISISQIKFIEIDSIEFINEEQFINNHKFKISNFSDSWARFNWSMETPEQIKPYFEFIMKDLSICWPEDNYSNCSFDKPNIIGPIDTGFLTTIFYINNEIIPNNLEHLIDSIKLHLTNHPECTDTITSLCLFNSNITSTENVIKNQLEIFPNPTEEVIYLKNKNPATTEIKIFDINGSMKISLQTKINAINVHSLEPGMYILFYKNPEQSGIKRFLKL